MYCDTPVWVRLGELGASIHLFHGNGMLELCCRVSRDDLEVEQCQT